MDVLAKFYVLSKTEFAGGNKVELQAVTENTPENAAFWKYTPAGRIELQLRHEAKDLFGVGKSYYVRFEEA
jgi:hypothetical protein